MIVDFCLTPLTKVDWKWIKDLNIRLNAILFLPGILKVGNKPSIVILTILFFNLTAKTQTTKAKINKQDYIELKSFCTVKETINEKTN